MQYFPLALSSSESKIQWERLIPAKWIGAELQKREESTHLSY